MSITLYLSIIIYCESNTYLWGLAQGAQHKFQKALLGAYYLHTSIRACYLAMKTS